MTDSERTNLLYRLAPIVSAPTEAGTEARREGRAGRKENQNGSTYFLKCGVHVLRPLKLIANVDPRTGSSVHLPYTDLGKFGLQPGATQKSYFV